MCVSSRWGPPNPTEVVTNAPVEPPHTPPTRVVSRLTVALAVLGALALGAAAAFGVTHLDRRSEDSVGTLDTPVSTTLPTPVTLAPAPATAVTSAPVTTAPVTTTTTLTATTAPPTAPPTTEPVSPVIGDHMVFHDGVALGQVTPTGFVAYIGDPAPQLRQGEFIIVSMSTLVRSQAVVQVRALAPNEEKPRCPVGVQPRPAANTYPVGLWVELPTWTFAPAPISPGAFGALQQTMLQTVLSAAGVPDAPTPSAVQVVTADLAADGIADTIIAASFRDDAIYYRVVVIAADDDPARATTAFFEQGPSVGADGVAIAEAEGTVTVDAIAELTGFAPYELAIRVRGGDFAGATLRTIDGAELASWACPV